MSLSNLSLSGNQMTCVIENALYATMSVSRPSYFGGIIGCLVVAIGVVYFGGMAAFELLSYKNEKQEKLMESLQLLLEKQQEKINILEKDLNIQKLNSQTWYNLQTHCNNEYELMMRTHAKVIAQHSNNLKSCFDMLNTHTTITDNHTETLMNVVRHQEAQTTAINQIHKELEEEKKNNFDVADSTFDQINELREELDKFTEQMDQSFIEAELKLEDAIEHFQSCKDAAIERMNSLEEELFEKVLDVSVEFEDIVDGMNAEIKMIKDHVEEVDREVESLEKEQEKVVEDLGTLYDDFLGVAEKVEM